MSKVIEEIKTDYVGVEVIENKGKINFKPFNVRQDGQGTTPLYDCSSLCLLKALIDKAIDKYIK